MVPRILATLSASFSANGKFHCTASWIKAGIVGLPPTRKSLLFNNWVTTYTHHKTYKSVTKEFPVKRMAVDVLHRLGSPQTLILHCSLDSGNPPSTSLLVNGELCIRYNLLQFLNQNEVYICQRCVTKELSLKSSSLSSII